MSEIPSDLISITEASKLIPGRRPGKRIHVATLYSWVRRGRLRAWRVGGGHLAVSRADVLRLLEPVTPDPEVVLDEIAVPPEILERRLKAMGVRV